VEYRDLVSGNASSNASNDVSYYDNLDETMTKTAQNGNVLYKDNLVNGNLRTVVNAIHEILLKNPLLGQFYPHWRYQKRGSKPEKQAFQQNRRV